MPSVPRVLATLVAVAACALHLGMGVEADEVKGGAREQVAAALRGAARVDAQLPTCSAWQGGTCGTVTNGQATLTCQCTGGTVCIFPGVLTQSYSSGSGACTFPNSG